MNTKLQERHFEDNTIFDHGFDRALSVNSHQIITALGSEDILKAVNDAEKQTLVNKAAGLTKTFALLIASPFIALAYIITLPFIGFYQFAKLAFEAYSKKHPKTAVKLSKTGLFIKNVSLFLSSPFIALAYLFALPFVGFYMFTKLMLEAKAERQSHA